VWSWQPPDHSVMVWWLTRITGIQCNRLLKVTSASRIRAKDLNWADPARRCLSGAASRFLHGETRRRDRVAGVLHAVGAVPQVGSRSLYRLATCRADLLHGRPPAVCSAGASNSIVKATPRRRKAACRSARPLSVAKALYETSVSPEGLSAGCATVRHRERVFGLCEGVPLRSRPRCCRRTR